MNAISSLDRRVLAFMLSGEGPIYEKLRSQLPLLKTVRRKMTGIGYVSEFVVTEKAEPVIGRINTEFTGVSGTTPDVKHGVAFALFIRGGLIDSLEGFTFASEDWPADEDKIRINTSQVPRRTSGN